MGEEREGIRKEMCESIKFQCQGYGALDVGGTKSPNGSNRTSNWKEKRDYSSCML